MTPIEHHSNLNPSTLSKRRMLRAISDNFDSAPEAQNWVTWSLDFQHISKW